MFCRSSNKCRSGRNLLFSIVCCTFALLIWAKLKLVAGVPRTAVAEPDLREAPPAAQPVANDPMFRPRHVTDEPVGGR